jgi:hypothetical protein
MRPSHCVLIALTERVATVENDKDAVFRDSYALTAGQAADDAGQVEKRARRFYVHFRTQGVRELYLPLALF